MESVNYFDAKLFNSSHLGDLEGVVDALAQGGRVAMRHPQGHTPLLVAARNGHTEICGLLLAHGSNVNEMEPEAKMTALHLAAGSGHQAVVEALLSWGAILDPQEHEGATPLLVAALKGHTDMCGLLLAHGSDVNQMDPTTKMTALHMAAFGGHEAVVKALLSWGAIVDPALASGAAPLCFACRNGHLACVLALLKAGASVSVPNVDGDLPIHIAAKENRVEIVRTLLDYGCSPDMLFSQNKKTPLMAAAFGGADETVAFLLSKGADPDLMCNNGDTALVAAIQSQRLSTIDLLAPVTQKGLGRALQWLAISQTERTPAVEGLLKRARSDDDALRALVDPAAWPPGQWVTRKTESTPAAKELLERGSSDKEMRKRKRKCFCFCF